MTAPLHPAQILRFAAAVTPPLAVIAPRALAVLLPLVTLAAAIGAWKNGTLRRPPMLPAAIIVGVLVWGAASAAWAADPRLVWSAWGQIAGTALAGLVLLGIARDLDEKTRDRIGIALAVGVGVALAFLALEWISSRLLPQSLGAMIYTRRKFHPFIFNRGAATLAILVWPAALALWRRYGARAAAALVLATLVIVSQFESMAAILGIVGGTAVWFLAARRPRLAGMVLGLGFIVGTACLPLALRHPAVADLATRPVGSSSISHRLQIWTFVAGAIAERPMAGWGLNASRQMPGGVEEIELPRSPEDIEPPDSAEEIRPIAQRLPLHPHNAILQWWLELGAVGVALGTALGLAALYGAMRLRPEAQAQAAALALFASAALIAAVGFGIWQAWWMAALWLVAALMAAIGGPAQRDTAATPGR